MCSFFDSRFKLDTQVFLYLAQAIATICIFKEEKSQKSRVDIQTWGFWVRGANATSVLCRGSYCSMLQNLTEYKGCLNTRRYLQDHQGRKRKAQAHFFWKNTVYTPYRVEGFYPDFFAPTVSGEDDVLEWFILIGIWLDVVELNDNGSPVTKQQTKFRY